MDKDLLFRVGEMAAIHDIPAKTLRYYDDIGLFKPAKVDTENNYRYYSIDQFELLNTIRFLRNHGFSINAVKKHLKVKDTLSFIQQMELQKRLYENELSRIRSALSSLEERIEELQLIKSAADHSNFKIKTKEERRIIILQKEISTVRDIEINLRELERKAGLNSSIIIGRVGLTVDRENLLSGNYKTFKSIFILHSGETDTELSSSLPAGEYASVLICSGDHSSSAGVYPEILKYIKIKGYEVAGDAIERVIIDSLITADEKEYTTEIEIPVSNWSSLPDMKISEP